MKLTKNKMVIIAICLMISICCIPITYSKYVKNVNTKIKLNIKSPKYTIVYDSNEKVDHVIPDEYLHVEYIEANGTQWIDTGLNMNGDYTLYMDGYIPAGKTGVLLNGYSSNTERQGATFSADNNSYDFYWYGLDGSMNETLITGGFDLKHRFQVVQDKNGITLSQHHHNVYDTYSGTGGTTNQSLYMFNTGANSNYKNGALYHAKVYDGGVEIRNFIPCYRKADHKLGMYDTIEGVFYENAGTGTFGRGIIHGVDGVTHSEDFTYDVPQNLYKNEFTKEDFTFTGWNTKADGSGRHFDDEEEVLNLSQTDGDIIILYAQWKSIKPAFFEANGEGLLNLMKMFANNDAEIGNAYTEVDDTITAFKRATIEQFEAIEDNLTLNNLVSSEDSLFDIYMWYDNGIIYYYSEADKVAVNGSAAKMFARMESLSDISGLADFDASYMTDTNRMFQDDINIVDLSPLANWDTSNVTDMTFMFGANAPYIMKINDLSPLANWDVSKVTSFYQTFKLCSSVTNLNALANWNVSSSTNFSQMFNRAGLTDALAIKNWQVHGTDNFNMMLANNPSLPANKKPVFTNLPGSWNSGGTYIPS